jgi:PhnB protein
MEISPYLVFNGRCAEAFKLYTAVLRGKVEMSQTHGESPMSEQVSPDWKDKIMHIRMVVGNFALMGSDAPPSMYAPPAGTAVSVAVDGVAEAERIFKGLSDQGTVTMPFQKTFWSAGFGMLTDRFGVPWMVNTNQAA